MYSKTGDKMKRRMFEVKFVDGEIRLYKGTTRCQLHDVIEAHLIGKED